MGEHVRVSTQFLLEDLPAPPAEFVERTVALLADHGVHLNRDGGTEHVGEYRTESEDWTAKREGPLGDAIEEIVADGGGRIRTHLEFGVNPGRVYFQLDDDHWAKPRIELSCLEKFALRERDVSLETARERSEALADLIRDVAVAFDPWLVVAAERSDHQVEWPTVPEGRPPDSGLEDVGWITVFGEVWFEHFGGRERMLDAPAYDVRELETGSVYVRTEEVPGRFQDDAEGPGELSAYEYLFEGKSRDQLEAELAERKSTYVDPFRDLETGELGSDPVVCQDHADFELPEVHYEHVPHHHEFLPCGIACCRRDGDQLWDARSGTFIRRVVDEDGAPMGDLPKDVSPEEEFVSRAVRSVHETTQDGDWIQMEDPEDESFQMQFYDIVYETGEPEEGDGTDGDEGAGDADEDDLDGGADDGDGDER